MRNAINQCVYKKRLRTAIIENGHSLCVRFRIISVTDFELFLIIILIFQNKCYYASKDKPYELIEHFWIVSKVVHIEKHWDGQLNVCKCMKTIVEILHLNATKRMAKNHMIFDAKRRNRKDADNRLRTIVYNLHAQSSILISFNVLTCTPSSSSLLDVQFFTHDLSVYFLSCVFTFFSF